MTATISRIRLLRNLPPLFAVYPLVWLGLVYLFAARARLQLGHWPAPYHPDPADLGFGIHRGTIGLGMVAIPAAILTSLVLTVSLRRTVSRLRLWTTLGLLAASNAILVILCQWDPGRVFEWFAD